MDDVGGWFIDLNVNDVVPAPPGHWIVKGRIYTPVQFAAMFARAPEPPEPPPMTEDAAAQYVRFPYRCPFCTSACLVEDDFDRTARGGCTRHIKCGTCAREWWEHLKVVAVSGDAPLP